MSNRKFLICLAVIAFINSAFSDLDDEEYGKLFSSETLVSTSGFSINRKCMRNKECVPYYKCQSTDGAGIFNIRSNWNEVECESLKICCETIHIDQSALPEFKTHEICGQANHGGLGKISEVATNFTQFGEFPWMMAVLKKEARGSDEMIIYISGGTLIHPRVVLSTAHNLDSHKNATILVRGGEWNTQSIEEILKHQDRAVKRIVTHSEFVRKNLHNDIALLFLETPFDLEPHINVVCLPQPDFLREGCLAIGWGKKAFGRIGSYQTFLKKVELPMMSHEECQSKLRVTRVGEDFQLHDGFMCAGGEENVDTCTGDGGGPLACPIPGQHSRYYIVGIVSWGIGCNRKEHPGVYIDVLKYMGWINNELTNANIDIFSKSLG